MTAPFDYIAAAHRTVANSARPVSTIRALSILGDFVDASKRVDALKKAIFYGKNIDAFAPGGVDDAPFDVSVVPENIRNLFHGVIGIASEAGELVEPLYESLSTAGELVMSPVKVKDEGGDSLWYHALAFHAVGYTFLDVQLGNIAKLQQRFPEKFTEEQAINRDIRAELRMVEGGRDDQGQAGGGRITLLAGGMPSNTHAFGFSMGTTTVVDCDGEMKQPAQDAA